MARRMIDLGASVVIGHHPHVLQGVERYREGVILYSLGNFFLSDFTLQNGERWTYPAAGKQFGIATVTASKEGVQRVSLSGGKVTRRFRMVPYGPVGRWRFSRWITRISEPLSRSDFPRFFRAYNGNVERALLWHGRVRDARVQWRSIRNHGLRAAMQYLLGSRRSLRLAVSAFSVLIREAFFRRTR